MAGIKADATQFWLRLLDGLKAGMPARNDGKNYTNKEVEGHFRIKKHSVISLFDKKSRNYQARWSEEQMAAFNRGEPDWEDKKVLLASVMWDSVASARCKKLAVTRDEFESVVAVAFDRSLSYWENWQRGCEAADKLASSRFANAEESVKKIVESQAAHFIGKLTNSNVTTGAVLALPEADPQPYLYSATLGEIPLDCAVASRKRDASSYCEMRDCFLRVRKDGRAQATEEDIAIADAFEQAIKALATGENRQINQSVDYRLRQIVVPKENGYVALTPLGAAGVSQIIFEAEERLPGQKVLLPVGGSNRQNVTSFTSVVGRVIVRDTPLVTESGVSLYLRLEKRGYWISVKRQLSEALDCYGQWLERNRFVDGRDSVQASEIEVKASGISRIVSLVLDEFRQISEEIQDYLGSLEEEVYQEKVDALCAKGPIEAAVATGNFTPEAIDAMSEKIVALIDRHKFRNDQGKLIPIALEIADRNRLNRSIRIAMKLAS